MSAFHDGVLHSMVVSSKRNWRPRSELLLLAVVPFVLFASSPPKLAVELDASVTWSAGASGSVTQLNVSRSARPTTG